MQSLTQRAYVRVNMFTTYNGDNNLDIRFKRKI